MIFTFVCFFFNYLKSLHAIKNRVLMTNCHNTNITPKTLLAVCLKLDRSLEGDFLVQIFCL